MYIYYERFIEPSFTILALLMAMTDKDLILRLKQGDEAAFTALYKLYWGKVHNFLVFI